MAEVDETKTQNSADSVITFEDVKHFDVSLSDKVQKNLSDILTIVETLRSFFKKDGLLPDQKIIIPLDGFPQAPELTTFKDERSLLDTKRVEETLFYSDITAIALDILGWLKITPYTDFSVRKQTFEDIGKDKSLLEYGFWENRNEIIGLLDEASADLRVKLFLPPKEPDVEVDEVSEEKKDEIQGFDEEDLVKTAKVTKPDAGEAAASPSSSAEEDTTPEQQSTRQTAIKIQYESAWLYNFTLHQVALQLGVSVDQISAADRQKLQAEINIYLQDPKNLSQFYDLKNVDITRAQAFRDLFGKTFNKLHITALVAGKAQELTLDTVEILQPQDDLLAILKNALPPGTDLSNPTLLINLNRAIELAIDLKGEDALKLITVEELAGIIKRTTNQDIPLENLYQLQRLLGSYVSLNVSQKVLFQKNESIKKGIVADGLEGSHYDITQRFGSSITQTVFSDKDDELVSENPDDISDQKAAGKMKLKQYRKIKRMYAFWGTLPVETQDQIILYLKELDPQANYERSIEGKWLVPANLGLFDFVGYEQKKRRKSQLQEQLEKDPSLQTTENMVRKAKEQAELEAYLKYKHLENVSVEYKVALLNYIKAQKQANLTIELEALSALLAQQSTADMAQQQAFIIKQTKVQQQLQALATAELEDFKYATLRAADEAAYAEYSQNEAGFMQQYAPEVPPRFNNLGDRFNPRNYIRNGVPAPALRHAAAVRQTANKVMRGANLAKSLLEASTGLGFAKAFATNKDFRNITIAGIGGLVGGALAGLVRLMNLGATAMGATIGGTVGFVGGALIGGPVGAIIGAGLGGTLGAYVGDALMPGSTGIFGGSSASLGSATAQVASPTAVASSLGTTILGPSSAATATATTAAGALTKTIGGLVTKPIILAPVVAMGFVVGLSLYTIWVIQWSFLAPLPIGTPATSQPTFSQYVAVTKTAVPNKIDNQASDQSQEVTYTITIAPKSQYQLQLITITDQFRFLGEEGAFTPPQIEPLDDANQHPIAVGDFGLTEDQRFSTPVSTTYTATVTGGTDVLATNSFTMRFRVFDAQGEEVTTDVVEAKARLIIGNPVIDGCWPTNGKIYQLPFGLQNWETPYTFFAGYSHRDPRYEFSGDAFDITNPLGQPGETVRAPFAGTLTRGNYDGNGFGHNVILDSGGNRFIFAHLMEDPFAGDPTPQKEVEVGDEIGFMGSSGWSSGPHLHYGISPSNNNPPGELRNYVPDPNIRMYDPVISECGGG